VSSPLASERDRAILRSFSRRIDPSDAGAHNNLGVLYYNKGLHEESVGAFMRALELDPKMQVAQRNLEIAYFQTGFYERRLAELRERLRAQPDDRDARWELARAHAAVGDTREAISEFVALLRHHPRDLAAMVQLALAEKAAGDLVRAQEWLDRALALDPRSSLIHFYTGEVLYNRGLNDEAREALGRTIELAPDYADAHYLLGFVLGDMGLHEEARLARGRAIELNPALSRAQTNLSLDRYNTAKFGEMVPQREERRAQALEVSADGQLAHYSLGLAFRQKGYYAEALREYQAGLDRGEDRALGLQAMAEVHLLTGASRTARELYDETLALQAESPKLWNERGVALHQEGLFREAGESYARALRLDGQYALASNNLGVALSHAGVPDEALDAFRDALAARPGFTKAWLNLALLLFRTGRLPLSLEAYRRALESEPEHPVAWNGIGLVQAELRRFEEARNAFGRAIQARPEFAEAHYNLSFTLSNLGDYQGALRETKRALELDSFYVAQRFELAIDVQYEDADIVVLPDLDGEQRSPETVDAFAFDPEVLAAVFTDLACAPDDAEIEPPPGAGPYELAADYLSKGLYDSAAAEVSRAMARGAERSIGLTLLGDAFAARGLHGEALERYAEARQSGGGREALFGLVRSLAMIGRGGDALPHAEELLVEDGALVETLLLVARVRMDCASHDGARALLQQAHAAAPSRADVLKQLGDLAREVGDPAAAIAAYREAVTRDGDLALARFELARLLADSGDGPAAEAELLAALEAVPTYVGAALELSRVRRRAGRARAALDPMVELLYRDPYNLEALMELGETLLELERPDDAAVAFERVLRFDPANALALYNSGVVCARRNDYRAAVSLWRQAAVAAPGSDVAARARADAKTAVQLGRLFGFAPEAVHAH
jgi:tetratricopeptide (TPR) repeat protein